MVILSPAVGSFLGVLVERLPQGQSILTPSACAACGVRLRWRQMVPILSALILRHRCAACGATIPGHLIRVELASIAVAVAAVLVSPGPIQAWALVLCLWLLVALFYADLLYFRLPDPLTGALFLCALGVAWIDPARSVGEAALSGVGAAAAFASLRWGYKALRGKEGMGFGDVKLAAGIGALVGWQLMPWVALIAALMALIVALTEAWSQGRGARADTVLPFGSYLAGATLLVTLL